MQINPFKNFKHKKTQISTVDILSKSRNLILIARLKNWLQYTGQNTNTILGLQPSS
jgi:hypothetical protein